MIGVLVVVAVAAVVQLATGFGFALVSVPLLALVTDAHEAVLLALLLGTVGNLGQTVEGRKVVDRSVIGRLLLGALVGLPLGWIAFTRSDARVLQLTIGAVILVTVVALARGATLAKSSRRVDLLVGALSGVLTTCTGTNGPPVVAVLHARREPPEVFRATATTTFLALDVVAISVYAATGHLTWGQVTTTAPALPALAVGGLLGVRVRRLLSPGTFRVIVLVLLTVTAATAIVTAL